MLSRAKKCKDFTLSTGNENRLNCFQDGRLPGVEAIAMETSIQSWSGVDKPLDAALMFNFFYSIEPADRQALFQKLYSQHLAPNGIVIINADICVPTCGFLRLMERLGRPSKGYYGEVEKDMLDAGFTLAYTQDIKTPDDLSNPSDDLVKFMQILANNKASEQKVRAAIADIYGSTKSHYVHTKIAIFTK